VSEFLTTLRDIRRGGLLADCEAHLTDLVMGVRETGRPGEILVRIKIAPASKGNVDTLVVTDDVRVKRPKPELGATIFFATSANTLRRNDPRQPELSGLREVVAMPPRDREEQAL
jgi:hypothetical protein